MAIKLRKLVKEGLLDNDERQLTHEQKKKFVEAVKSFNKYGKFLHREGSLVDVAKHLYAIAEIAEKFTMNEAGDWFDKITVQRNMKELKKYGGDFAKIAKEAQALENRLSALYEDMGYILDRYYQIDEEIDEELENIKEGKKK